MAFGAKIRLSVDTSKESHFRSEIQKYVNKATVNNPIKLKHFSVSITKERQKMLMRDLQAYLSEDKTLVLKIGSIDARSAVNKLRQQLQTMLSGLSITGLKEFLGETNIDKITQDIDKAKQSASQWAAQMRVVEDIQKRLASTYKSALSGNQMIGDTTKVQEITAAYTAWQVKVEELRNTKVALSAEELQNLQQEGIALQQKITLIQEERAAATQAATEAERAAVREEVAARKQLALTQQQISLKSQVQRYITSNSRAYKAYGADLDTIMYTLETESKLTDEQLKMIRMRFNEIQTCARAAGLSGNTFFDTMKKGFAKFGGWSLITRTLMAVYRILTNMITNVKELDTAMTELKKVTNESDAAYNSFLSRATDRAKKLGAALSDTVSATADFARLGYNISDSEKLADASIIYKNVGDGIEDINDASESIIATMQAFSDEIRPEDVMKIVDKFNEVGNNYAISSKGIGDALLRSAAAMHAANNTLDETIALVTAANTVVQDPEKVGTALKTISMYLRAAKTEAEDAGESTDGMANSVSELRKNILSLTENKVDIQIDENTFKSTYQILNELASIWGELTDVSQANILEMIGGKRNSNVVASLLENFSTAESVLKTSSESAGSALSENEKVLDSIQGKLNVMGASFETLSQDIFSSESIKGIIEASTAIINFIDSCTKLAGVAPTLTLLLSTILQFSKRGIFGFKGFFSIDDNQLTLRGKSFNNILRDIQSNQGLFGSLFKNSVTKSDVDCIENFISQTERGVPVVKAWKSTMTEASVAGKEAAVQVKSGAVQLKSLRESADRSKSSIIGAKIGVAALNIALNALIMYGISKAIEGINNYINRYDNYAKKIEETTSKWNEQKETIENHQKTINEVSKEYSTLSDGVDAYGQNVSLTSDQYNRYIELSNQIADMYPELVKSYDAQGNAILSVKNNVEDLTNALKQEQETYYNSLLVGKDAEDTWNNFSEAVISDGGFFDADDKTLSNRLNLAKEFLSYIQESKSDITYQRSNNQGVGGLSSDGKDTVTFAGDETAITEILKGAGLDKWYDGWSNKYVIPENERENAISALKSYIDGINTEINGYMDTVVSPILDAYVKINSDGLDDSANTFISSVIKSFDFDWVKQFYTGSGVIDKQAMLNWIQENLIDPFTDAVNGSELSEAWANQLDAVTKFQSGNMSEEEFMNMTTEFGNILEKLGINPETRALFCSIIFDEVEIADGVSPESAILNIKERIGTTDEDISTFLTGLNYKELKYLYENCDLAGASLDELRKIIKDFNEHEASKFSVSVDTATESIEKAISAFNTVKTAISDYNKNGYLTLDNLKALLQLDDKYIAALTNEQGALDLSTEKYKELVKVQGVQLKAALLQEAIDSVNKIDTKAKALSYLDGCQKNAAKSALSLADAKWSEALASATARDIEEGTGDLYRRVVYQAQEVYNTQSNLIDTYLETASTTGELSTATYDYQKNLEKEKDALEKSKNALEQHKSVLEDTKDNYEKALNAIQELVDWTEKYIEQTKDDEIKSLEDKKKSIDDLVESQKELLKAQKDEYDWNKEISDKQNSVAKNALAASIASLDDSSAGKKAYKEATDNLNESRSDMTDSLYGHSIDARIDALDKMKDLSDEYYDGEIDKINEFLDDEVALYKAACSMIDNDNGTLYSNLLNYCKTYTTTSEAEFNHMWTSAQSAMQQYNIANLDTFSLINNLQTRICEVNDAIDDIADSIKSYEYKIDGVKTKLDDLSDSAQKAASNISMAINSENKWKENHTPKWYYDWQGTTYVSTESDKNKAIQEIIGYIENQYGGRFPASAASIYGTIKHYATGTKSAKGGLTNIDEEGLYSELIPYQVGDGRYTILPEGNPVFSKLMTNRLFDFASNPISYLQHIQPDLGSEVIPITTQTQISPSINITIQGDATQSTVNALRTEASKIINKATENVMNIALRNKRII